MENKAGPGLGVPPDATLQRSGTDPAAEVGRAAAPLLWVVVGGGGVWGETERGDLGRVKVWGWHPGGTLNIRQIGACAHNDCSHSGLDWKIRC